MKREHETLEDETITLSRKLGNQSPSDTASFHGKMRLLKAETVRFAEPTVHVRMLTCLLLLVTFQFHSTGYNSRPCNPLFKTVKLCGMKTGESVSCFNLQNPNKSSKVKCKQNKLQVRNYRSGRRRLLDI